MRDAVIGGEEIAREDGAGVAAREMSRFGDGVEDLTCCEAVHGQVVDGFVGYWVMRDIGGLGEHGSNGAGVGVCEGDSLG